MTRGRSSRLHRSASPGSAGQEPTTSPARLEPARPQRADGELGVVEGAEPGGDHDDHLDLGRRRPGAAARSSRVPPSVSSRTSSPPAPSTITVVVRQSGDPLGVRRRRAGSRRPAGGRRCRGRAARRASSTPATSTPVSRATSRASESPSAAPGLHGLHHDARPGLRDRQGRGRDGLADAGRRAGDDEDPHPPWSLATPTSTVDGAGPVVVGDAGADRDPQPGDAVRHRGRPEAADPDALRAGRGLGGDGGLRRRHRHRQHGARRRLDAQAAGQVVDPRRGPRRAAPGGRAGPRGRPVRHRRRPGRAPCRR